MGQRRKEGWIVASSSAACPAQSCIGPWLPACGAKAQRYYYSLAPYSISGVITF